MRLYAASASATNLVKAILERPSFEALVLACEFWRDRAKMDPAVQENLLQKLNEPLELLESDCFEFAASVQPRYFKLAHYLRTSQWKQADYETYAVMAEVIGKPGTEWLLDDISTFPCDDLHAVDQLWVKYSNSRFGFSVQRDIWLAIGGTLDGKYDRETWEKFCDRIHWRKDCQYLSYDELTFQLTSAPGHLPVVDVVERSFEVGGLFSRISHCKL